jgi:hypothetical protein
MLRLKLTPDSNSILNILLKHPVFSAIISEYLIDENFIYFPASRINNKDILNDFIEKGLLIRCDDLTLKPLT